MGKVCNNMTFLYYFSHSKLECVNNLLNHFSFIELPPYPLALLWIYSYYVHRNLLTSTLGKFRDDDEADDVSHVGGEKLHEASFLWALGAVELRRSRRRVNRNVLYLTRILWFLSSSSLTFLAQRESIGNFLWRILCVLTS